MDKELEKQPNKQNEQNKFKQFISINQIKSWLNYAVPEDVLKKEYRKCLIIALSKGLKENELINNVLILIKYRTKKYRRK